MDYKQLGNTGTLVSELCLGTMTFGGKGFWEAIGKMPQKEATALVKQAVDSGVNFIDTANIYSEGLSEILLGKAIKDLGLDRQQLVIATKVRGRMGPGANQLGLSQLHIIDSVHDSLKRLQLDHIDLLYIHGVDPISPLGRDHAGAGGCRSGGKSPVSRNQQSSGMASDESQCNRRADGLDEIRGLAILLQHCLPGCRA
jgi:aryl-alcohol dehydrogenase-like predicted oxidoreductase